MQMAVIDDEKIVREQVKRFIEEKQAGCLVDTYSSAEEFLISGKSYDILFLDIQMEGMSGMELAKKIRKQEMKSVLIFITGIREYVFEAFDVFAFHYLLKPIDEKKFGEVLEGAIQEVKNSARKDKEEIFIKTRFRNITLNRGSILYIENRGKKVEIHTTSEVIEMYAAMKDLEKQLGNGFYRSHRGYLVNMAFISEYNGDSIMLQNGECIFLAKERYREFVREYMRYLQKGGNAYV